MAKTAINYILVGGRSGRQNICIKVGQESKYSFDICFTPVKSVSYFPKKEWSEANKMRSIGMLQIKETLLGKWFTLKTPRGAFMPDNIEYS